jgi:hypothetical protein
MLNIIVGSVGVSGATNNYQTYGLAALLKTPKCVTSDGYGNLLFCDSGNNRVYYWDATTDVLALQAGLGSDPTPSYSGEAKRCEFAPSASRINAHLSCPAPSHACHLQATVAPQLPLRCPIR